jgi:hypothetical protein
MTGTTEEQGMQVSGDAATQVLAVSQPTTDSFPRPECLLDQAKSGLPWIVLAVVPFALIYVAHFSSDNGLATGFIHADMPYYAANGREVFERGNGFAYPNPYDPSADAPVVYFHWLLWLLGVGIARCGLDPGLLFVGMGAIGALLMSGITWCLVHQVTPRSDYRRLLFFMSIWGGGLLCVGKWGANLSSGVPPGQDLMGFDPGQGLWFLNWGRNITFPTESIYHALVGASWWCAMTRRHWWSICCAALLAATHPWSGLEILLTVTAFHSLRLLLPGRQDAVAHFLASAVCLANFLAYNLVWLDSIPQHRALHQTWQLHWSLTTVTMLLAWGPVAVLAALRILFGYRQLSQGELLLGIAFCVACSLSVHDRFMTPTQPLHFARGYVWMPLMLLAIPGLQKAMVAIRPFLGKIAGPLVVAAVFVLACTDNLVFVKEQILIQYTDDGLYFLSQDQRDLLERINADRLTGVVLIPNEELSYLTATYTSLNAYIGHQFNTPQYEHRKQQIQSLRDGKSYDSIDWLDPVRYVISADLDDGELSFDGWTERMRCGGLALLEKPAD